MVSIIILSYNTKELLGRCLQSVYRKVRGIDFEVIVVDNASSDGSSDIIKREFKKVILVENERNVGFSKGNNIGAVHAHGEHLLFLNSDTEILDGDIEEMARQFLDDEKIGIIGGKILDVRRKEELSAGKFLNLFQVFFLTLGLGAIAKSRFSPKINIYVDFVSGGCMMVKKELFDQLGGFDEHFFMYIEDMEFCYRINKASFKVLFYPKFIIRHLGQGSSNRSFAIVQIYKGILYFFKKHKSFFEYVLVKMMLSAKAEIAILLGTVTQDSYLVQTYKSALRF